MQDEPLEASLEEILKTPRGLTAVAMEGISLIAMLPFLYIEGRTVWAYGLWQWATLWNIIDIATYGLQV